MWKLRGLNVLLRRNFSLKQPLPPRHKNLDRQWNYNVWFLVVIEPADGIALSDVMATISPGIKGLWLNGHLNGYYHLVPNFKLTVLNNFETVIKIVSVSTAMTAAKQFRLMARIEAVVFNSAGKFIGAACNEDWH